MIDLRSRLHDVVDVAGPEDHRIERGATALDDVLVGALTAQVRRRRAVRAGALGTVGALTVALLAVGGAAVAERLSPTPVPPATDRPVPDDVPWLALDCGARVATGSIQPVDGGMTFATFELLSGGDVPAGRPLDLNLRFQNDGDLYRTWDTTHPIQVAALRDGTVVATGSVEGVSGSFSQGSAYTTDRELTLAPCTSGAAPASEDLAPGDYELVASAILADADGSDLMALSQGPVPFTVRAAGAPPPDDSAAQEAVRALVEGAVPADDARPVGTCGTRIPSDPDPHLVLEVALDSSTHAPGSGLWGDAAITARDDLTVSATAPAETALIVLARDGVVVGRMALYTPEYADLTFTSEPYRIRGTGAFGYANVCTTTGLDGPAAGLPDGTYEAYGLYPVTITDVQRADGTTVPRSGPTTLVADLGPVVVAPTAD